MGIHIRRFFALMVCALAAAAQPRPAATPDKAPDPKRLVSLAYEAMGGEARVKEVKTLRLEWAGHALQPENSERPEGPWLTTYQTAVEDIDVVNSRIRIVLNRRSILMPKGQETTLVITGGVGANVTPDGETPAPVGLVQDLLDPLRYGPLKVLPAAAAAPDLRYVEEIKYQGVPHQVVAYGQGKNEVRILFNAGTHLPTAVDWTASRPAEMAWAVWGDFKERAIYGSWSLEGGILFPRQLDLQRNGLPFASRTCTVVTLNPAVDAALFHLEDRTRLAGAAFGTQTVEDIPLGLPNRPAVPLRSSIIYVPGRYGVVLVRQADGIVVLDAPISAGYSRKVMEEVNWRFRGAPVKALVSTDDSWPHIGGVREYIASGVPVYALDLNQPLLERVAAAPHTNPPDQLAKQPKQPMWNWVNGRTSLGSGPNRLELIPFRGEGSERTMGVYFPDDRLLYSSDLILRTEDGGFFWPSYLGELIDTVKREKLNVEMVVGMNLAPTAYGDLVAAYQRAARLPAAEQSAPPRPPAPRPAAPKPPAQLRPGNQ
jgi:hypothetical protein